ncbi:MAG: glutamine--fructose-6-phosphate aminotransferase, partial [Planctomycetales bacterium]
MCGIVGYLGNNNANQFLIEGLRRLEYRGYDSSGIATISDSGDMCVTKTKGRIGDLVSRLADSPTPGTIGIGHTRWATHGQPSDLNAHPHVGGTDCLSIVHNGVIENYQQIKQRLA